MDRDTIVESIARTLYVSSYADACENEEAFGDLVFDRSEAAGSGEDWLETVRSATPPAALKTAQDIVSDFEASNKRTLEDACAEWLRVAYDKIPLFDADEQTFGHYLAMQALGHGVGLWDEVDQPEGSAFDVGFYEFTAWDWVE